MRYHAQLLDDGADAGSIVLYAEGMGQAMEAAAEWARGGDWDHPGTVVLRITSADGKCERQEIDVG